MYHIVNEIPAYPVQVVEGKVEEQGGGSGPTMLEEQEQEVLTPIQALRQEQQVTLSVVKIIFDIIHF